MIKCNVGKTDKIVRFILAGVILIAGIVSQSWLGLFGLILIISALIGWCPLYFPFGIRTNTKE